MNDLSLLLDESARLLKPGGQIYFETPHPKSLHVPSPTGAAAGTFTLNFFDDPTHVRVVGIQELAQQVSRLNFEAVSSGISRNWLFAASWPLFMFLPASRKKFTAQVHWIGWSAFLIARRHVEQMASEAGVPPITQGVSPSVVPDKVVAKENPGSVFKP
jgi:hypothetical protein